MTPSPRTIVDCLRRLEGCTRHGARFVHPGGDIFHSYDEVLRRALAAAGALQARGLAPGERVAIVLPTSVEFLETFLGVQLAGGVPAALYPPLRLGRLAEYSARTRRMLERIDARFLVTDRRIKQVLGGVVAGTGCLESVLEAGRLGSKGRLVEVDHHPDDPAFLQFSSGTTLDPKAVVITHANLLANLEMIDSFFRGFTPAEVEQGGVCWLPLYHDMGLLGHVFVGLYHPGTVTYLGPEQFITRPSLWLRTISRYRAVISGAPDFAYGLCTSKIKDQELDGVDLSSWAIAFDGAEPISTDTLRAFATRFARWGFRPEALTPVYGLAEAGLAVSFSEPHRAPIVEEFDRQGLAERGEAARGSGRRLASVGRAMPGLEIVVRHEDGRPLGEGRVGRVTVRGPSVAPGYFGDPELSGRTFRDGWLETGDLGFVHEGQLYISGRLKDLIIIRGRNYAPQEIEELLQGVPGLRVGCCVAFSDPGDEGQGERLVILAERDAARPRPDAELRADVIDRILRGVGLQPGLVELLPPGTLPRTSSGKLRRAEAKRQLLATELSEPQRMNAIRMARELVRSRLAWVRLWLRRTVYPAPGWRPSQDGLPEAMTRDDAREGRPPDRAP